MSIDTASAYASLFLNLIKKLIKSFLTFLQCQITLFGGEATKVSF